MTSVPPIPGELWEQIPAEAQRALLVAFASYEARLAGLQEQLGQLQAQVAGLQQRLGQNSTNSSKPPSSDPPAFKRRPPQQRGGRPKGGQQGHARFARPLLPADHVIPCKPDSCRRCGQALAGDDPDPLRHQVLELPPVKPQVTEYQRHRLLCPCCGTSTCAPLPEGVPQGGQGPRLMAAVATLTGAYRLSKRQAEALMADLFGVPLCAGQVCACEGQVSDALGPVVEPLKEHVKGQPANLDETSWRLAGGRAWLWVAVTQYVTVYHLVASRGAKVVRELLGPGYAQTVTSDRFKAYAFLALSRRQLCWAHLRRDFQAMIDRDNEGSGVGRRLLTCSNLLFDCWYRVRDGTQTRGDFRRFLRRFLRPKVRELLREGSAGACAKTAATCAELLASERALWTFAYREGVEPTNNAAERALRHAVLWRRNSQGSDSEAGGLFVGRILSVVETCRQQGRNVLDFLTQCCQAALHGAPPPSLLPATNS